MVNKRRQVRPNICNTVIVLELMNKNMESVH